MFPEPVGQHPVDRPFGKFSTMPSGGDLGEETPGSQAQGSRLGLVISQPEDRVGHPSFERLVVHELLEEFRIILQYGGHNSH